MLDAGFSGRPATDPEPADVPPGQPEQGGDDGDGELSRLLVTVADRNAEFVALQTEFWLHAVRNPDFMAAIAG